MGNYVYILTNRNHMVLYIGATTHLERRLYQHKNKLIPGFTSKYHVTKLVYYERYESIRDALFREKQLKGKTRAKKEILINSLNPDWLDLSMFPSQSTP